jgi:hypothetical protein
VLVLDGKTLQYDRPFSHDGYNYPANWLRLTTWAEKEAIGIQEVPDPAVPTYDQRFWWGPELPKDLDGLKTLWTSTTNETANKILAPSDWMVVRKADSGVAVPAEWTTWRQSIREAAQTKIAALTATTSVPEFQAYIVSSSGAESDYSFWPADPDQPVVEAPDEEVTTEPEVVSAGTVVTGGVVDGVGEDTVIF